MLRSCQADKIYDLCWGRKAEASPQAAAARREGGRNASQRLRRCLRPCWRAERPLQTAAGAAGMLPARTSERQAARSVAAANAAKIAEAAAAEAAAEAAAAAAEKKRCRTDEARLATRARPAAKRMPAYASERLWELLTAAWGPSDGVLRKADKLAFAGAPPPHRARCKPMRLCQMKNNYDVCRVLRWALQRFSLRSFVTWSACAPSPL